MKVLICDDLPKENEEFLDAIKDANQVAITVDRICGSNLREQLETLFDYVDSILDGDTEPRKVKELDFDSSDIIILDNNLADLRIKGARLTAESISGYVRAFTTAFYIISLNKNSDVDFDLRYLVGDYATRADLALNTNHLSNPALWTGNRADAKDGFTPWYWPELLKIGEQRRLQIDFVANHLQDPVLATLGFPHETVEVLSRHARGALSPDAGIDGANAPESISLDEVTFQDVFTSSNRSLPDLKERQQLSDMAKAGDVRIQKLVSQVVAAQIEFWIRRDVLGPQEILVDVPHLFTRMPFLLGARAGKSEEWNKAVRAEEAPYGIEPRFFTDFIAPCASGLDIWTPVPAFWWPKLDENHELNALFSDSRNSWANVVFCEDISGFVDRETSDGEPPKEFLAEFEGPWARRHVQILNGYKYKTLSRFVL